MLWMESIVKGLRRWHLPQTDSDAVSDYWSADMNDFDLFYLLLYAASIVVQIVALRKPKKRKRKEQVRSE